MIARNRMSKKRKNVAIPIVEQQSEPVTEPAKARVRFVPRDCSACSSLRGDSKESYSFVYHTAGRIRYCKCRYCGNTWTQAGEVTT